MMRLVTFFIILLFCGTAYSQDKDPDRVRYKLPTVETNNQGQKCLDVQQWKQVFRVSSEYLKLFNWKLDIEPAIADFQALDMVYTLESNVLEDQVTYLEARRDSLEAYIAKREAERLKSIRSHKIEKGFMWGVIVIETVVIGVLGTKSAF